MRPDTRQWLVAISALLCIAFSLCYYLRRDSCAALTFFPAWVWLVPGIIITIPALKSKRRRWAFIVLLMWAAFILAFDEEPRSLLRSPDVSTNEFQSARAHGKAIRVITLNCAGGNANAAAEVKKYRPDIVLLQESPGRTDIKRLTRELYAGCGEYVCCADDSIIARGHIEPHSISKDSRLICTSARIKLHSGLELEAISLRLIPPTFRVDLWSPGCWRDQAANRRIRRSQAELIASMIDKIPGRIPIIAGGDFNAPAGDGIFAHLRPRMHDSFAEHGVGWGNTVLNEVPVQRVDQIWADRHFSAVNVRAYKTRHSDHRMVVCDLIIR